jgi:hypothetical protein
MDMIQEVGGEIICQSANLEPEFLFIIFVLVGSSKGEYHE